MAAALAKPRPYAWTDANWLYCRYGYRLTTPAVRHKPVEGLSNSVLSIDLIGPFPPHPLGRFANRPLAGAGKRAMRNVYRVLDGLMLTASRCTLLIEIGILVCPFRPNRWGDLPTSRWRGQVKDRSRGP